MCARSQNLTVILSQAAIAAGATCIGVQAADKATPLLQAGAQTVVPNFTDLRRRKPLRFKHGDEGGVPYSGLGRSGDRLGHPRPGRPPQRVVRSQPRVNSLAGYEPVSVPIAALESRYSSELLA
jgi:hypothetical protein